MAYHLHDRSVPDISLSKYSGVLSFDPVELPPLRALAPAQATPAPDINIGAFLPNALNNVPAESPSAFYLRMFGASSSVTKAVEHLTVEDTSPPRPVSKRETQSLLDFSATTDDIPPPSPGDRVKKSSILSLFESVDSDFPTPPATPAAQPDNATLPAPPTPATVAITLNEEYAFTQKGTTFEQFHFSGKLSEEVTASATTKIKLSLHLLDTSSHLQEVAALNNHIMVTPPDIFSTYHDRYTITSSVTPPSPADFVAAYTSKPTFKPALLRARSLTAKKDNLIKVSVQVQLNTLFPLPLENVQVKVALASIVNHSNVRSKPVGHYDTASKVVTWNCGSQCSAKNPNINMDLLIEQTDDVPLPPSVPIMLTATTSSTVSGVTAQCHEVKAAEGNVTFDVKSVINVLTKIKFKCVV